MATHKRDNGCLFVILASVTLLIFVSGLPAFVMYQHYVSKEAGIRIYKTPSQWVAENQAAAKALSYHETSEIVHASNGYTFHLNERIDWVNSDSYPSSRVRRLESRLVDRMTNEVLVKEIRFTLGDCSNAMPIIYWLQECSPPSHIGTIQEAFHRIGLDLDKAEVDKTP